MRLSTKGRYAVTADAHPENTGRATLALRFEDGVEHRFSDAFEIPARLQSGFRELVLGSDILAAATLGQEGNQDLIPNLQASCLDGDLRNPDAVKIIGTLANIYLFMVSC